jgi:hypothetical protein
MIRPFLVVLIFVLAAMPGAQAAKRHLTVNTETPEGVKLKALTDEADPAKKLVLMERFANEHPKHDSTTWVLGEMQTAYLAGGQFDKAIAAGEKVLAEDAEDVAVVHNGLKAAEGKKDPALIKKWAMTLSGAAKRAAAAPKPADADEAEAWTANVAYAKQNDAYSEYALYVAALQTTTPAVRIDLGEALEKQNPASQYVGMLRPYLANSYQQSGNAAKALETAEAALQSDPANDDMLLFAASKYYEAKNAAKWAPYAKKLAETLPAKPAPQGMNEAAWNQNKSLKLGVANWMLGVAASNEQRWADADTYLRVALPNVQADKALTAETLFHLALANYRLGDPKKDRKRIDEALKFNTQCAAIASPFQAQARKNIVAIKGAYKIP